MTLSGLFSVLFVVTVVCAAERRVPGEVGAFVTHQ